MSIRDVANTLIVAHEGLSEARASRDYRLHQDSLDLIGLAVAMPEFGTLMTGIAMAAMDVPVETPVRDPVVVPNTPGERLDGTPPEPVTTTRDVVLANLRRRA